MAIPIQLKRSTAAGVTPTTLADGEVAINVAASDPKLFYKDSASTIRAFSLASYVSSSSPSFTGDATFTAASGGSSVPVTITNEGTGNSFVVNDAPATDSTPFVIDAAGRVIIGGTAASSSDDTLAVVSVQSAGTGSRGIVVRGSAPSGTTFLYHAFQSVAGTAAASFTLSLLRHFIASQGTFGAGSTVTDQFGFFAASSLTGATNNYGFYGDIESGSNRWNFYANGTAANYFKGASTFDTSLAVNNTGNVVPLTVTNTGTANSFVVNDASGDTTPFVIDANGRVVIGGTAASSEGDVVSVINAAAATGNVSRLFVARASAPSSSTSAHNGFQSSIGTDAASFTVSALRHFIATQGTLGAGSSVTDQYGFAALSTITGATNNYGFYSDIASGTGRFNFYANGTAANYFAGPTTITSPLTLTGTVAGNVRALKLQTSGVDRWQITPSFDAETGSNAGSNLHITRWSDAGSFMGTPLYITRSTGVVNCESGLTIVSGQLLVTAGSASACGVAFSGDVNTGLAQIGGTDTASLVTAGVERVRVDASGNVGIGVSPSQRLHVIRSGTGIVGRFSDNSTQTLDVGVTASAGVYLDNPNSGYVDFQIGGVSGMRLTGGSELLIGTTTDNGAYRLQVNSQIYATNATIATSDARFKTNVEPLTDATSVIEALRPVAFDFIPHEERNFATERQVGLIAQEAQSALAGTDYADSVVAQCGDHLGLAYEKLVPVLIKALQESNARIAALEERTNA